MKKLLKVLKQVISSKAFIFSLAALIMFLITYSVDLLSLSGDAQETWKVAQTFFSQDKYYSYVMYKGVYAFLPCVLDIFIAGILNIPQYIIFKLFNALCFGYVAAYGIPNLVGHIHKNEKVSVLQRYLLVALLIIFESNINFIVSVDMMSCAMFFALCNSAMNIVKNEDKKVIKFVWFGIWFGLNMCLSGQFAISTVIVAIALIINTIYKHFKKHGFKQIKSYGSLALSLLVVFCCYYIAKLPNQFYMNNVVEPARAAGQWIPTGQAWIINGLSQNLLHITYPSQVPDNLSMGFLTPEQLEQVNAGGAILNYGDYIQLIIQHPVRFLVRWSERLFLGIMNDPQNLIAKTVNYPSVMLVSMAVIVYSLYDRFKARFTNYKDIISVDMAIYLALLFSALVPSFGHVENRYFFTARCFIFGVFAISPYLNQTFESIKNKIKEKTLEPISWRFWGCAVFVLLSLIIYYAIYQSAGIMKM
ncbi:MAG: hypothetical protein E7365_05755 [Clostridiales bacterium]|nr:hypothetical protein [Clostridiales bacterium]